MLVAALAAYLQPSRLLAILGQLDPGAVRLAALLGALGVLLQWVKWQGLLSSHDARIGWRQGLHSLLVGFALGLLSPGRLGELARGVFLGGERAALVGLALLDRLTSVAVTLSAAWVALWILSPRAGLGASLALFGLVAGLGLGRGLLRRAVGRWRFLGSVRATLKQTPPALWVRTLAVSALFNAVFFAQFYLLMGHWDTAPAEAVWGIPLVFGLKAMLPLTFLDLGVREGAAVLVFSRLHMDPGLAFNAALMLFFINVVLPGLVGMVLLQQRSRAWLGKPERTLDLVSAP